MKVLRIAFAMVVVLFCLSLVAQTAPANQPTPPQPAARTDVYHVQFTKAVPGKESQLAEFLRTFDAPGDVPGHKLVLAHEDGDEWDYVVIHHIGPTATVKASGTGLPESARALSEWHGDTFVNGPAWAEFAKAMGLDQNPTKGAEPMYVVSVYRALPGQREQLERFLSSPPNPTGAPASTDVLFMHLEGGPWNYISVSRFNSWQDFAGNEAASVAQMRKGSGGWFELRRLAGFHRDTLAVRVAP